MTSVCVQRRMQECRRNKIENMGNYLWNLECAMHLVVSDSLEVGCSGLCLDGLEERHWRVNGDRSKYKKAVILSVCSDHLGPTWYVRISFLDIGRSARPPKGKPCSFLQNDKENQTNSRVHSVGFCSPQTPTWAIGRDGKSGNKHSICAPGNNEGVFLAL